MIWRLAGGTAAIAGLFLLFPFSSEVTATQSGQDTVWVHGVVYHDRNGDRRRDASEPGIAKVRVSNGRHVVVTDRHGSYRLGILGDAIVFVIKPSGWMVPLNDDNLPQFFYLHKPTGSPPLRFPGSEPTGPLPASVDFPLYAAKEEKRFRVVVFGDVQVRDERDVSFFAHDVVEELVGVDAAFGVTLGDIVHDNLPLFSSVNQTVAEIGIPWFNVIGNHDLHKDAPNEEFSDEAFERVYGPTYYSFDYGRVHFVVLDNVFVIADDQVPPRHRILPKYGVNQMEFLRNDLSFVPKDRLVILLMHMPLRPPYAGYEPSELSRLLCDRPYTFSLSAHFHRQEHVFLTEDDGWCGEREHHHLIHAATCGSIWSGEPDEFGIPHSTMCCGSPNGYSIMTLEGGGRDGGVLPLSCTSNPPLYAIEYKTARRPAAYQMNIFAPDRVRLGAPDTTHVYVNVFAGSERSVVEMRVKGLDQWIPMTKVAAPDPLYARLKTLEQRASGQLPRVRLLQALNEVAALFRRSHEPYAAEILRLCEEIKSQSETGRQPSRPLPQSITDSPHLWEAHLPPGLAAGTHLLEVRTIDMFGQSYTGVRVIQLVEPGELKERR